MELKVGDYVVATKYSDGDPGDHFCVGYYAGSYDHYGQTRHLVNDPEGNSFRHNGFRRSSRVGRERGEWMVANFPLIERLKDQFSVWHWWRAPWWELHRAASPTAPPDPPAAPTGAPPGRPSG